MNASNLDVVLVSNSLELRHSSAKLGKFDVDGCTESCTKISWARSDVSEMLVVSEFGNLFDLSCSLR